jgi:RNA polymerase sigma-70 factor, ECF subfamily
MNSHGPVNEKELIAASKNDPHHFRPVYEYYYPYILNYIYHRTNEIEKAADIASVVFYKALVNLAKYRDMSLPFGAWLYRIAFTETMQYFRNTKKMRYVILDDVLIEKLADDVQNDNRDALIRATVNAVKELKQTEHEIIDLKYFQQKTNREIAFILGMSEGNLKVKVHRIIEKLKKIIAEKHDTI